MAVRKTTYNAVTAPAHTLAALATSAGLTAGRESDAVDNSTAGYPDYAVRQKLTTGTTPTAGTAELWVVPSFDGTTWPAGFGGADAAKTVTSRDVLYGAARLGASTPTDTTSDRTYELTVPSVRDLFGTVPRKFSLFVTHNAVAALNATESNHDAVVEGYGEDIS